MSIASIRVPRRPDHLPPRIIFTRGRKRTVDTSGHFCPDPDCSYHDWLGLGNIRANGHPGGQPWRQLQCVSCQGYFDATHGTIFHGQHSSPELIAQVIACLAEGLGIRGTARVFEINANTVLHSLMEAVEQLQAFSAYFLHHLHLNQVQLDELYAILSAVRDGEISEAQAVDHLSTSPRWVWTAVDPESNLMLNARVGDRSPAPKPRWMPLSGLLYAQVVKKMRRRRIVEVKRYVVIGTQATVDEMLKACGWVINTAFIERLHLSLRQRVAPIRRRRATSCKGAEGLSHPLILFQVYHNFVLAHAS